VNLAGRALRWILIGFAVGLFGMVSVAVGWNPFTSERVPYRLIVDDLAEGTDILPLTQVISSNERLAGFETSVNNLSSMVDFDSEVLVVFDLSESGSCPFGPLKAVEADGETGELRPVLDVLGGAECTTDEHAHRIIVAIDRDDLPEDGLIFEF
jgi:hypothetical protein